MTKRSIILGDLHLVRHTPPAVAEDLAALAAEHAGERLVFVGDLFDFSADTPKAAHDRMIAEALGAHPAARRALGAHLDRGGEIWLVGGNHDANVGRRVFDEALRDALGVTGEARARLKTSPWFLRDGALHVEHGHLFDPDNAPAHPLVVGEQSLGVHFAEEFIAPTGAYRYLLANDDTPLELFLRSFTWYGPRAPYVIYRYFYTAISAMLRSGPLYRAHGEPAIGRAREAEFAEEAGVPRAMIDALLALGEEPTMKAFSRVFTRVYFDRVIATIAMGLGVGAAALAKDKGKAAILFGLGALLMGASWAAGHNRYAGTVADRLAAGAKKVAGVTGAKLVVFGHTHREALDDGYANTGSFAFPRDAPGRPYLMVESSEDVARAERRYARVA